MTNITKTFAWVVLILATGLGQVATAATPTFAKLDRGQGRMLNLIEMHTETRTRLVTVPREITTADGRIVTIQEEIEQEFQVEVPTRIELPSTDTQFRTVLGQDVSYREVYGRITRPTAVVVASESIKSRWLELLSPDTLVVLLNSPNNLPAPSPVVNFELTIPGTNVFSIARLSGRVLTLTLAGERFVYQRFEEYDSPRYVGYYNRRHKLALRWPRSDKGVLFKGDVMGGGAVRFYETRMRIVGVQKIKPGPDTIGPNDEVLLNVINNSGQHIKISYYDTKTNKELPYNQLKADDYYEQPTFVGHLWFAKDLQGNKVAEFTVPRESTSSWVIRPSVQTTGFWKSSRGGMYIDQGNGKWLALDPSGQISGRFEERERTDEFLAIYDGDQQRWVRIYNNKAITTGAGIDGWQDLGEGKWDRR